MDLLNKTGPRDASKRGAVLYMALLVLIPLAALTYGTEADWSYKTEPGRTLFLNRSYGKPFLADILLKCLMCDKKKFKSFKDYHLIE